MKLYKYFFLFFITLNCSVYSQNYDASKEKFFDAEIILNHIKILASDSLEGRASGSEGERKAAEYIINEFQSIGLQPLGENGAWTQAFEYRKGDGGEVQKGIANNIIAYLDNQAALTVVIGAHYDHLGYGHDGNSLEKNAAGQIHNGADDNASGVAGVIELARYFSLNNQQERFNFLFICFSAEELGLQGSKHFVKNPTLSLDNINFMINMDMVGRLKKDAPVLTVSGTGTAAEWEPLLKQFNSSALSIKMDSSGIGASDHSSFYHAGIPALHFFSGAHTDYHKPSDDWDKINASGQEAILFLIASLIHQLENKDKLTFLKTRNTSESGRARFKVSLGIMPSYTASDQGVLVEAVMDGKPAQAAGILDGDIITGMGEHVITNIQDYMKALGTFEKGMKIQIKVLRNNQLIFLELTF
jgi:hypothetical protein